MCSKVCVECKICFGECEEASSSSSSQSAPLTPEAFPKSNKLGGGACIETLTLRALKTLDLLLAHVS